MDEDLHEVEIIKPLRHDRWSVLIVGLNWLTRVANVNADTLDQFTMMAAQHANQKKYDEKFGALTEPLKTWGN